MKYLTISVTTGCLHGKLVPEAGRSQTLGGTCAGAGLSWLCEPSYVVSRRRESVPERSTCLRTRQPADVHLQIMLKAVVSMRCGPTALHL